MFSLVQHKRRWAIVASAFLLCAVTGCDNSQKIIVGQWRAAGDSSAMVWEFSKDGSVLMEGTKGKYSFGHQKQIKIQTPFATSVYQIEISESRMTLTGRNGSKLEFTKVR